MWFTRKSSKSKARSYKDAGGFTVDVPGYEQPLELILIKALCLYRL